MLTPQKLQSILKTQTAKTHFIVGYSGGLDSHVLLHAISQLPDVSVTAVHVNHQVNPKATQWTKHCKTICDALNVPISIETVTVQVNPGDSLEAKAREARYKALAKYADKETVLLTAHTLDDQAETFLLQALRGSGVKGLSAMPVKKQWQDSFHLRPLLSFSREDLEAYAMSHQLQWIEDDSNADTRFDRNFLRHEIMPVLKRRFPSMQSNFARCARHAAEADFIIHTHIKAYADGLIGDDLSLNYKLLLPESDQTQRLVLRYWLAKNKLRMPSEKQLKQIQKDVLLASSNAKPRFVLGGFSIRRNRQGMHVTDDQVL